MRRPLGFLLAAALAAALALGSCGDDGGDGGASSAPAVKVDTKRLRAIKRLAPADRRALERALRAFDELDDAQTSSEAELEAVLRPALDACAALDPDDPLLSVLRASCPALGSFLRGLTGLGTCEQGDDCRDVALATVAALRVVVKSSRVENRAVGATRLPRRCKRVLDTSRSAYRGYALIDAALEEIATAMESGTDDDRRAALAALAAFRLDEPSSGKSALRRFRAHCR